MPVYRAILGGVWCGRVLGYNVLDNVDLGVYNVVFVVTLIVYIIVKLLHYIPLLILWL